jgi:hypothetical protein
VRETALQEIEKQEILRLLGEGSRALDAALTGVDEETAHRKPEPDRWSIVECVEHLVLTEAALLRRLGEAKESDRSHYDQAREEKFQGLAMNRARRIDAPEPVLPGRHAKTLAEAVEGLNAVRKETVRFVEEFNGELRSWLTIHPLIARPVNCYEMLLLLALHPKRHALQIVEAREAARRMIQSD